MDTSRQQYGVKIDAHEAAPHAARVMERCRELAAITDVAGETTRTFLSPAMRAAMARVKTWMEAVGCDVTIDAAGNLRGIYPAGIQANGNRLLIASHLDTVPNAGAYDGVLGVMIGLSLLEMLKGERLSYAIEVVAFSEEEGVRFRLPFIGSKALAGRIDDMVLATTDSDGIAVGEAIRSFGLDPSTISEAVADASTKAYLEFHIEQGPVLENEGISIGIVEAIAGQTRGEMVFLGSSNHAGTTPMHLRRDAVAATAEWIIAVEREALGTSGLLATVGRIEALPGAGNVVAGEARASLDVRHSDNDIRRKAVDALLARSNDIAAKRGLRAEWHLQTEQQSVMMDIPLTQLVETAVCNADIVPLRMTSGAGHDAMIIAERIPSAMIFLQSPGGLSHHPDESVRVEDVSNALAAGYEFLKLFDQAKDTHA
jgi:allantoate deiminase